MRTLNIFISSPGDVGQERMLAERAIERLQGEFAAYFILKCVLWEDKPMQATSHFQDQINEDLETADIMIGILWQRLGTQLPKNYVKADGTPYLSGTEWEFDTATRLYQEAEKPVMMVFRKTKKPDLFYCSEEEQREKEKQRKLLEDFWRERFGDHVVGFKKAYTPFETPEEFEDKLETHLRSLIKSYIPDVWTESAETVAKPTWFSGSPYRGLETFDVEHAPVFFGRTKAIGELKDLLVRQANEGCAFLLVFGGSGSGKSSLMRAGFIATVIHPGVVEGVDEWRWAAFRPGDADGDSFRALAEKLVGKALPELIDIGVQPDQLATLLREDATAAVTVIKQAMELAAERLMQTTRLTGLPVFRLLIAMDQTEELFTAQNSSVESRRLFVKALAVLAQSGIIWIVGTMRSDFYARCAEIPELVELKSGSGQYDLLPPSFSEIGQIITKPTYAAGLCFEKDPVSGQKLDEVLHEAASRTASALPLLEFTLAELYKRRQDNILTFDAYWSLGGMEGALARYAEGVFEGLPEFVRKLLPDILRALVTVEHGEEERVSSRRTRLEAVANTAEHNQLVQAFVQARLLVIDTAADGVAVLGVAHEALLRCWPRVHDWLEEEREFLRARAWLDDERVRWEAEQRRNEYLLPEGKPLSDASEVLLKHRAHLTAENVEYIEASLAKAKRRRRNKRIAIGITAMFFLSVFYTFLRTSLGEKLVEFRHDLETVVVGGMDIAAAEKFGWVSDQVAVLDIDHKSYVQWGKPEITPRDKLAEMIAAVADSGAKVIALDIFLDEVDYAAPHKDEQLRQTLQRVKAETNVKILFPVKMYSDGTLGTNLYNELIDDQDRFFRIVPFVTIASRYDNKMRFWYPYDIFVRPNGEKAVVWGTPLLAVALANNGLEQLHKFADEIAAAANAGRQADMTKQRVLTLNDRGKVFNVAFSGKDNFDQHRIKYYLAPAGTLKKDDPGNLFMRSFPVSGLNKTLALKKDIFRDKIVIIGNSSPDKHDILPTPIGYMPGMYVHGNVMNTMIVGQ